MKTAIVYYSRHHENTKKLIDAIAAGHEVDLIDVCSVTEKDLSEYEIIGFASGIYYSKFHKSVLNFAEKNLPEGKKVFFLYTCGAEKSSYTKAIEEIVLKKSAKVLGAYGCLGFDTYGPFKLVGGVAKGHPTQDEVSGAVEFFEQAIKTLKGSSPCQMK